MIDTNDLQRIFARLRANRRSIRHSGAEERIARLERLRTEVADRAADIGEAIHADLGRPADNRDEIETVMGNLDKVAVELADWMKPVQVPQTPDLPPAKDIYVQYEPRGVVLLFGTWDFPIGMFFSPLIQAIAAGNVVLAKTSDLAPATAAVIAEIVRAAFAEDEVAVVTEADDITNDDLLELPVDHIFLTGSRRVGRSAG